MQLICYNINGDNMYIIDYNPKNIKNIDFDLLGQIEYKLLNKESLTEEELTYFLTVLSYRVRLSLSNNIFSPCLNMCDKAQSIICDYLNKLDVRNHPCMTINAIVSDIVGHSFVTAHFSVNGVEKIYLVDPTYQQFLLKEDCSEDKFFYHENQFLIKPAPGYYIKSENYSAVSEFISRGYNELTREFAEIYGDSFYNTKLGRVPGVFEYKSMTGNIYIKTFTKGNEQLSLDSKSLKDLGLELHLSTDLNINKTKNNL